MLYTQGDAVIYSLQKNSHAMIIFCSLKPYIYIYISLEVGMYHVGPRKCLYLSSINLPPHNAKNGEGGTTLQYIGMLF